MTIVEKRQKRAAIWEQMKTLNDAAKNESRSLSNEESQKWDKMKAEMDQISADIKREEFIAEQEKREAAAVGHQGESKEQTVEAREAFDNYARRGERGLSEAERRSLEKRAATDPNTTTDGEGGYTVPEFWSAVIEKVMKSYGGILDVANVIPMAQGGLYNHPVINDTSNVGAIIGEGVADAVNQFTDTNIPIVAYTYTSKIIKMSIELIQDTGYPLTQTVLELCAERVGRILNTHLTTGTGSSQPFGVVTGSAAGKTAAAAAAITRGELVDLRAAVDAAYRNNPSTRWMFNSATEAALMKLDYGSSDSRPLWSPSLREGEPDRLLGVQYVINEDMPDIEASAKPIIFGDFSKYVVRQVRNPELVTFREKYMDERCYGYNMFARYGGRLVNTTAIKHLVMAAS